MNGLEGIVKREAPALLSDGKEAVRQIDENASAKHLQASVEVRVLNCTAKAG